MAQRLMTVTVALFLLLTCLVNGHAREGFVLKIVGHTPREGTTPDGKEIKGVRLFVQLRTSEKDPLPPTFRPSLRKFKVQAGFGSPTVRDIGPFGGDKGLGGGVSTLLMIDISGSMVQYWDRIYDAAISTIEHLSDDDQLGIAFFGGDWVYSGMRLKRHESELKEWLHRQFNFGNNAEEVFGYAEQRRDQGRRKFGKGWRWWQDFVDPVTHIETTKLYNLLYFKALDEAAKGTRDVKALVILSDMKDESQWQDAEGGKRIEGDCVPDNNCATIENLKVKATELRVPIFAIGFMEIDEDATVKNRLDLDMFDELTMMTRGEYQETAYLQEMDSLFGGVRDGLDRLVVMDVEFRELPQRSTGFNYLTIRYLDDSTGYDVESLSYKVPFAELRNATYAPVDGTAGACDPVCRDGERCVDGACVGACVPACGESGRCLRGVCLPLRCCTQEVHCPEGTRCLLREEALVCTAEMGCTPEMAAIQFDDMCLGYLDKKACTVAKPVIAEPTGGDCKACKEWDAATGQCRPKLCDADLDDRCAGGCICRKGTGDQPDFCEIEGPPPEFCKEDDHCKGKCGNSPRCICALKVPDPDQCYLPPKDREGERECQPAPETCPEGEFPYKDSAHCGCIACETDRDCIDEGLQGFTCKGIRGDRKTCEKSRGHGWLLWLVLGLMGVLFAILLAKMFLRTDPLKRQKRERPAGPRPGAGPGPRGPK